MGDFLSNFWKKFTTSWKIIIDGFTVLFRYPVLLVPMLISWVVLICMIIIFAHYFNPEMVQTKNQIMLLAFGMIMAACFVLSLSSLILLELIQQIETSKKINLLSALYETFIKDIPRALPIMLLWAVIWFILELLTPKRKRGGSVISEIGNSILGISMDLLKSGVRLLAFLIFPAIAWEDEGPVNAVRKGLRAVKNNAVEFTSGFIQMEFVWAVITVPLGIAYLYIEIQEMKTIPDGLIMAIVIYYVLALSLYLYLQQMFTAILYMWNMNWEKAYVAAKMSHQDPPTLYDIKKPDLLDNIADLNL